MRFCAKRIHSVFALAAVVAWTVLLPANCAPGKDQLLSKVSMSPAIMIRQQRDHRVSLHREQMGSDQSVHVYTSLSDYEAPFSFSLGWFVMVQGRDGDACLDEFGERVPMPGAKPERSGFNKAELLAVRGFDYVGAGNMKDATSAFEAGAKHFSQNAKVRNNLGACLAATGQYGQAQKEFDAAIKLKPDYALAYANRAWLSLLLDQPKLALVDLEKALGMQGDLKPAVLGAVRTYLYFGNTQQARVLGERAFIRWPDDVQSCILAGDAHLAAGDARSARTRYQKALVFGPNNPRVLLKLAGTAERLGDLDDAIRRARGATQISPDDAETHLVLGKYLELNRNVRAAQVQYERALEVDPSPAVRQAVYGPLLRVLMKTSKRDEADKLSKRWLSEHPQNAECRYNRAWVTSQLSGKNNKLEAIDEYRKALALNPELVQAHYNLAILLVDQGKNDEAARELRSFIEKSPNDPDCKSARDLLAKLGQ